MFPFEKDHNFPLNSVKYCIILLTCLQIFFKYFFHLDGGYEKGPFWAQKWPFFFISLHFIYAKWPNFCQILLKPLTKMYGWLQIIFLTFHQFSTVSFCLGTYFCLKFCIADNRFEFCCCCCWRQGREKSQWVSPIGQNALDTYVGKQPS